MNRSMLRRLAIILGAFFVALSGAVIARATGAFEDGNARLTGPQAERGKAAALRITNGGHANAVERDSEQGATYEIEVTRADRSTVDVRLDENLELVAVDADSETSDSKGG